MSVLIKGMKMPKTCDECDFNYDSFRCILPIKDNEFFSNGHYLETDRLPNCPLIELPPHGRLIDGDIAEVIVTDIKDEVGDFLDGILYAADWIANQPTIIEAEEVSE